MDLVDKFKRGLEKASNLLKTDIRDLFKDEVRLVDEEFLHQLFETLVKTDMGVRAATETVDEIRSAYFGRVAQMEDVLATIKERLKSFMTQLPDPGE